MKRKRLGHLGSFPNPEMPSSADPSEKKVKYTQEAPSPRRKHKKEMIGSIK